MPPFQFREKSVMSPFPSPKDGSTQISGRLKITDSQATLPILGDVNVSVDVGGTYDPDEGTTTGRIGVTIK